MSSPFISQVAKSVPFDNSSNGFTSTNTQAAIEEVANNANSKPSLFALFSDTANNVNNKFLSTEGINASDTLPSVCPITSTIKYVTYTGTSATATGNIEFRINTSAGSPALTCVLSTGAGKTQVFSGLTFAITAGDTINCKVTSTSNCSKPLVKCFV